MQHARYRKAFFTFIILMLAQMCQATIEHDNSSIELNGELIAIASAQESFLRKNSHKKERLKYVIGPWQGGMAMCLHSVLNQLLYCEKNNRIPVVYWNSDSFYFDTRGFNGHKNVWNYYFQPLSKLSYRNPDKIHVYYEGKGYGTFNYYDTNQEKRNSAYRLIKKYIKPNKIVQNKIDDYYKKNMSGKKTIGIHIRGTDKHTEEKPVDPYRMVEEALKHADADTQFFVASDEKKLISEITTLLKDYRVISYDCYRSEDPNQPLHLPVRRPSRAQLGEDVVIEMILLSKCNMLIHTLSNVSAIPLYFNPSMPHVLLK